MPYRQHPFYGSSLTLVARTGGAPMALANPFCEAIRAADPDVPVRASTMTEMVAASVATPRSRTLLVGAFALLALALAIAGVYGGGVPGGAGGADRDRGGGDRDPGLAGVAGGSDGGASRRLSQKSEMRVILSS